MRNWLSVPAKIWNSCPPEKVKIDQAVLCEVKRMEIHGDTWRYVEIQGGDTGPDLDYRNIMNLNDVYQNFVRHTKRCHESEDIPWGLLTPLLFSHETYVLKHIGRMFAKKTALPCVYMF